MFAFYWLLKGNQDHKFFFIFLFPSCVGFFSFSSMNCVYLHFSLVSEINRHHHHPSTSPPSTRHHFLSSSLPLVLCFDCHFYLHHGLHPITAFLFFVPSWLFSSLSVTSSISHLTIIRITILLAAVVDVDVCCCCIVPAATFFISVSCSTGRPSSEKRHHMRWQLCLLPRPNAAASSSLQLFPVTWIFSSNQSAPVKFQVTGRTHYL